MTDITFREAKAPAAPEAPVVEGKGAVIPGEEVEVPVVHYEDMKGKPYAAEFFELGEIWDDPEIDYARDLRAIDEAYKLKVQANEYKDGAKSYKEFIREMEKQVGVKDTSPTSVRVAKIAEYVRFMNKLLEIDKNKAKYGHN